MKVVNIEKHVSIEKVVCNHQAKLILSICQTHNGVERHRHSHDIGFAHQ